VGAVFRPKDFSPDTKNNIIKLLDSWEGRRSEEKLREILGKVKAEEFLKNIEVEEGINLTDEDQKRLKNIFKESLTFD
jgi:hypothetical protein